MAGDMVEFHLSKWAKGNKKPALKGKIEGRRGNLIEVLPEGWDQQVTVHVSLITITKPVLRIDGLTRKFEKKPTNKKKSNTSREVTNEVGAMTFTYKKK